MDQDRCYAFGLEPETLAACMMGLYRRRATAQANGNPDWRARPAEQNRRRETRQDLYEMTSLQRTGNPRFPVRGASSDGGTDRGTIPRYGANCRAR